MLLSELTRAPSGQRYYVSEPKSDGYRGKAGFGKGTCRLRSRNGADCAG